MKVVLADDHPLFIHGLGLALEAEGLEIVGRATTAAEVLETVARVEPDAVLLDLVMPGTDGVSCVRALREAHPDLKIVMLSGHDDAASVAECLDAGALCFVGKATSPSDIAHALWAVAAPSIHFRRNGRTQTTARPANPQLVPEAQLLTPRETEMLAMVATGLSNGAIARQLWVAEQTVKFHLSNIYRKLEVANRTQAARRGAELGLLDDDVRASVISVA